MEGQTDQVQQDPEGQQPTDSGPALEQEQSHPEPNQNPDPQPNEQMHEPLDDQVELQKDQTQEHQNPPSKQEPTIDPVHDSNHDPNSWGVVTFNIFVGDIKDSVDEEQLRRAFEACGPIHSVNIVRDKHTQAPMGYGFVHFSTKEAQQKALIPPFSNQTIAGYPCRVNCSDGKNTLFVGNLPPDLKEEEIRVEIEKLVGRATHVELKTGPPPDYISRGFAFVTFSDKNNAETAKRLLIGKFIRGFQVNVKWAEVRRVTAESMAAITTLYIGNLHKCITQEQLLAYYSQWGNVVRCNVVKDPQGVPKGFAFVTFDERDDCIQALTHSNNQLLCEQVLTVTLATPNSENSSARKLDLKNRTGGPMREPIPDPRRRDYPPAPGYVPGPPRGPSRGYWDSRPPTGMKPPGARGYEDPRAYGHPYEGGPPPYSDPYGAYPGYPHAPAAGQHSYYPHYGHGASAYPASSYPPSAYPPHAYPPAGHAYPPAPAAGHAAHPAPAGGHAAHPAPVAGQHAAHHATPAAGQHPPATPAAYPTTAYPPSAYPPSAYPPSAYPAATPSATYPAASPSGAPGHHGNGYQSTYTWNATTGTWS